MILSSDGPPPLTNQRLEQTKSPPPTTSNSFSPIGNTESRADQAEVQTMPPEENKNWHKFKDVNLILLANLLAIWLLKQPSNEDDKKLANESLPIVSVIMVVAGFLMAKKKITLAAACFGAPAEASILADIFKDYENSSENSLTIKHTMHDEILKAKLQLGINDFYIALFGINAFYIALFLSCQKKQSESCIEPPPSNSTPEQPNPSTASSHQVGV